MDVLIGLYQDEDTHLWGFDIPALHIIGGACQTRDEAIEHAKEAIAFTLEERPDEPGCEVVAVAV